MTKNLLTTLIIAALSNGCGANREQSNDSDPVPAPVGEPVPTPADTPPPAAAPTTVAAVAYSVAVTDVASLPPCDAEHQQQLAYVLATKQFQTCQAGAWQVVEIVATAPAVSGQVLYNRLKTIQLGNMLAELLPEAREILLGQFTHEDKAASTDACNPQLAGERYRNALLGDDAFKFSFVVEFRGGKVDHTWVQVGTEEATSESVACQDR